MRVLTKLQLLSTLLLLACVPEAVAIEGLYYKVEAQGSVSTGEKHAVLACQITARDLPLSRKITAIYVPGCFVR